MLQPGEERIACQKPSLIYLMKKAINPTLATMKDAELVAVGLNMQGSWLDQNTVDSWRHSRLYKALDPILINDKNSKWLTVGDGRFGKDAKYILDQGAEALATDISDSLLKEAKDEGYIEHFQKENAESLSFEDSEFDYTFCKESYHHFPRPTIALYEMLRVSKKGILLIEPNDDFISDSFLTGLSRNIKMAIKRFLGKIANKHSFEETGNFVYRVSQREMEKVALGLNYRCVAIKGYNDLYLEGSEYETSFCKWSISKKDKDYD